jgi:hypothetical protein
MVMALLFLTMFDEDQYGTRAWKGHDGVAMDRLDPKGYISDPKSKAKSVVVTVKGVKRPGRLFEKHFEKKDRKCISSRLSGDGNRAIPKQEEGTGADHDPSSPVPQRARNALRLRCAPGR